MLLFYPQAFKRKKMQKNGVFLVPKIIRKSNCLIVWM